MLSLVFFNMFTMLLIHVYRLHFIWIDLNFHYVCLILSPDRICPVALDRIFLPTWFSIIHRCHFPKDAVPRKIRLNSYKPWFVNCQLIYGLLNSMIFQIIMNFNKSCWIIKRGVFNVILKENSNWVWKLPISYLFPFILGFKK